MNRQAKNSSVGLVNFGDATGLPDAAIKLVRQAVGAMNRGDFGAAEHALTLSLAYAPAHPEPNRLLGVLSQHLGQDKQALASFREAAKASPNNASITIPMAQVLADTGNTDDAIRVLRELALVHENADTLAALAEMLGRCGHLEEAILLAERVLALDPGRARTRLHHALNLFHCGRTDEARKQFHGLIREGRELVGAWYGLAEMKTGAFDRNDLTELRKLCAGQPAASTKRAMALHALGKAYEDSEDWPAAMAAFSESARINRAAMPWNSQFIANQLATLRAAFSQSDRLSDSTFGNEVIFIVGMPRSGSTLTEQILAAHPMVEGGSELVDLPFVLKHESQRRGLRYPDWVTSATAEDWQRLGEAYLARTTQWRAHKPRFTDKYPANWMAAEVVLMMLPGARIIDCRRDPLEMLWSCFKQYFAPGSASWSYDFGDIVGYWKACTQHCDYLAARYPEKVRIQSYERLLDDPEGQTRELLAFCGLEFDPACMRFHEAKRAVRTPSAAQVREPIRRRASAGELYGELLDPLRHLIAE
ncbi:MAG: sulfotransferase [Rudaea sp.]